MKIAVYTIAKNEEQFVKRWADSCKDADYRFILDTGSADETIKIADYCGVKTAQETLTPFRFDKARNIALGMLPADIDLCIALDMDEVLAEGWRDKLEQIPAYVTRPRYKYVWSWNEDGTEGLVYGGDKIHSRHNYRWKHPVHETLVAENIDETQFWVDGLEIHHHPDNTKSRGQYFPLLKLAAEEEPNDDRIAFYLAREFHFYNEPAAAEKEFYRYLNLPTATWGAERSAAYCYLSDIRGGDDTLLRRAISEAPNRREPWVKLALKAHSDNDWRGCYSAAKAALSITTKPLEYLCETFAWGATPDDLAALAAHHLGIPHDALYHGRRAVELDPTDGRLVQNLVFYEQAIIQQNQD